MCIPISDTYTTPPETLRFFRRNTHKRLDVFHKRISTELVLRFWSHLKSDRLICKEVELGMRNSLNTEIIYVLDFIDCVKSSICSGVASGVEGNPFDFEGVRHVLCRLPTSILTD